MPKIRCIIAVPSKGLTRFDKSLLAIVVFNKIGNKQTCKEKKDLIH